MKAKKSLSVLILAVLLIFALAITACNRGEDEPEETPETTADPTDPPAADDPPPELPPAEETREVITYTKMVSVTPDTGMLDQMWTFDQLEELYGIRLVFDEVSAEAFEERKNLAFAAGNLPHLFGWGLSDLELAMYGAQGLILPLEDYINWEYTPRVMILMDLIPGYRELLYFPDGHIYNLQGVSSVPREMSNARFWINETWSNEILGHMPTNLEEYYTFLSGVRDMGHIPMSGLFRGLTDGATYHSALQPIMYAFGFVEYTFEARNGTVYFNPVTPEFREFLIYMNRLWESGLIDPEFFTQTVDQWRAKIGQGDVGAFVDWAPWIAMTEEELWTQYPSIPPMTSHINDVQMWGSSGPGLFGNVIMTNMVETPQHLIQIANFSFAVHVGGPDYYVPSVFEDFFGEHINTMVFEPDGRPTFPHITAGSWDRFPEIGFAFTPNPTAGATGSWISHLETWPDMFDSAYDAERNLFAPLWDFFPLSWFTRWEHGVLTEDWLTINAETHHVPYFHVGWPANIRFTADEVNQISLLETDLMSYVDQMISRFIMGELSVEDDFDNFVEEAFRRGLGQILEVRQVAYTRHVNR